MSKWIYAECNGSVNSVIWKCAAKVKNHGLAVVRIATAMPVCLFNDSATPLGHVLKELGVEVQEFAKYLFERKDASRIITAQRQSLHAIKEYRKKVR